MLKQTGLLNRRHPVVLCRYREEYHNFQFATQFAFSINAQATGYG